MTRTALPDWLDRAQFPFEPRLVDVGGGEQLSVTDAGSGRALVFSHGTPTWSYEWRHHLRALSTSHRCIAPDHLGFGLSPRPAGADYRPEAHARRFSTLLERLGVERYGLVVHDFGGPFALQAAVEHPERVERLVLYNTFAWDFADTPKRRRLVRWAGGGLFRWLYRNLDFSFVISKSAWGDSSTLTEHTWAPYRAVFPDPDSRERVLFALARAFGGSREFFESLWRRLDRLAGIPIHIVWGMKDTAFPADVLVRFRGVFPGASVLELDRAGHWPHEEQPERCVASVQQFLATT